jgi:predicted nucleotidyltransferase
MSTTASEVLDLDHVVMTDGRIYRVLGNLDHPGLFLGYNIYSPHEDGDRLFRGVPYRKNFTEDDQLPPDALDTYSMLRKAGIQEHHDPFTGAASNSRSFLSSPWFGLYAELTALFGDGAVGIFGSAMLGLHLTPSGHVRKDVDFVIEGTSNISVLREHLPAIRARLGFTAVSSDRQARQHKRYRRVFRNENNAIALVISRRWTALQVPSGVVTTIRFRDPAIRMPYHLASARPGQARDVTVTGRVADADLGNLFPRMFRLLTVSGSITVYLFWWKFSSPVRDGDTIALRGSLLDLAGQPAIRVSSFTDHWLQIQIP